MASDAEHIVKSYQNELNRLKSLIVDMGGMVEHQVADACEAVINRDAEAATQAVAQDPKVDAAEREIEQFVIRLLALRRRSPPDRVVVEDYRRPRAHRRLRGERGKAQRGAATIRIAVYADRPVAHDAAGAGEPQARH